MTTKPYDQNTKSDAAAGLAGLLIGAIAGATAVAISDKKTRQRLSKKSEELGHKAQSAINDAVAKMNSYFEKTNKSSPDEAREPSQTMVSDVPEHTNGGGERLLKSQRQ